MPGPALSSPIACINLEAMARTTEDYGNCSDTTEELSDGEVSRMVTAFSSGPAAAEATAAVPVVNTAATAAAAAAAAGGGEGEAAAVTRRKSRRVTSVISYADHETESDDDQGENRDPSSIYTSGHSQLKELKRILAMPAYSYLHSEVTPQRIEEVETVARTLAAAQAQRRIGLDSSSAVDPTSQKVSNSTLTSSRSERHGQSVSQDWRSAWLISQPAKRVLKSALPTRKKARKKKPASSGLGVGSGLQLCNACGVQFRAGWAFGHECRKPKSVDP